MVENVEVEKEEATKSKAADQQYIRHDWEYYYELLRSYQQTHGHVHVEMGHILYTWIAQQKSFVRHLPHRRLVALISLGVDFGLEDDDVRQQQHQQMKMVGNDKKLSRSQLHSERAEVGGDNEGLPESSKGVVKTKVPEKAEASTKSEMSQLSDSQHSDNKKEMASPSKMPTREKKNGGRRSRPSKSNNESSQSKTKKKRPIAVAMTEPTRRSVRLFVKSSEKEGNGMDVKQGHAQSTAAQSPEKIMTVQEDATPEEAMTTPEKEGRPKSAREQRAARRISRFGRQLLLDIISPHKKQSTTPPPSTRKPPAKKNRGMNNKKIDKLLNNDDSVNAAIFGPCTISNHQLTSASLTLKLPSLPANLGVLLKDNPIFGYPEVQSVNRRSPLFHQIPTEFHTATFLTSIQSKQWKEEVVPKSSQDCKRLFDFARRSEYDCDVDLRRGEKEEEGMHRKREVIVTFAKNPMVLYGLDVNGTVFEEMNGEEELVRKGDSRQQQQQTKETTIATKRTSGKPTIKRSATTTNNAQTSLTSNSNKPAHYKIYGEPRKKVCTGSCQKAKPMHDYSPWAWQFQAANVRTCLDCIWKRQLFTKEPSREDGKANANPTTGYTRRELEKRQFQVGSNKKNGNPSTKDGKRTWHDDSKCGNVHNDGLLRKPEKGQQQRLRTKQPNNFRTKPFESQHPLNPSVAMPTGTAPPPSWRPRMMIPPNNTHHLPFRGIPPPPQFLSTRGRHRHHHLRVPHRPYFHGPFVRPPVRATPATIMRQQRASTAPPPPMTRHYPDMPFANNSKTPPPPPPPAMAEKTTTTASTSKTA
mmetsp:Transcript_42794/g.89879  ORF Transcript_42794/g.89879 Transcript_42794/m.89879 type:complete len:810 (-) Transcript_42794:225-2654(-)